MATKAQPTQAQLLQSQLDLLDRKYEQDNRFRSQTGGSLLDAMSPAAYSDKRNALAMRLSAMQREQAGAAGESDVDKAKKRAFGLAEERLSDLRGDTLDNAMRDQLMRRISGQDQPYDQTTIDALLSGQAGQAAQVERNARAQLGAGDINDPSYRSRMAEIQAQRQSSGQAAALNINQRAHLANYDAQGQAINSGSAFNRARQAQISDAANRVIDLNSRVFQNVQAGGAPAGGGGVNLAGAGNIGQQRPPQPMQQSQPSGGAPATPSRPQPASTAAPAPQSWGRPPSGPAPAVYGPQDGNVGPMSVYDAWGAYTGQNPRPPAQPRPTPGVITPGNSYDDFAAMYDGVDRLGNRVLK